MSQARYWILTIPYDNYTLPDACPDSIAYIKGQVEEGSTSGYKHWQIMVIFKRAVRLAAVKSIFGRTVHAEPTKSRAASDYVWKEDTRVAGTQFELGKIPFHRNDKTDWAQVRQLARSGSFDDIPDDIFVKHFSQLTRIQQWYLQPIAIERQCFIYWGGTGLGKSHTAWAEAGLSAYPKDPRSKFWDGYRGQDNVVCDEFRGAIDVAHLLRWTDKYPLIVDVKGSSVVLKASKIWFTSNLDPRQWYPNLDKDTLEALLRRFTIVHFNAPLGQ